jgi:flagellar biosynthesis protein FliQ
MKRTFKVLSILLVIVLTGLVIAVGVAVWHARTKLQIGRAHV